MDLSKLSPAPWAVHDGGRCDYTICEDHPDDTCQPLFENIGPDDKGLRGEFVCLARNAFDVMMRRYWNPFRDDAGFSVEHDCERDEDDPFVDWIHGRRWSDPFIALVEADAWYKANVEDRPNDLP